jgi:hypothetical protein
LKIIEEFTSWQDFYQKPDMFFDELVEALGVDLKSLKKKYRPKGEVKEDL